MWQGIDICVAHRINCVWKYIVFAYNQQDIERARQLSQDLGMTDFVVDHSDRFDDTTQHLMPDAQFLGDKYQTQQKIKTQDSTGKVAPKCAAGDHHFISAEGFYTPCCYIGDHRFYYKSQFGKNKSVYDIRKNSLSQLLIQDPVVDFFSNLESSPLAVCQFNCPKT